MGNRTNQQVKGSFGRLVYLLGTDTVQLGHLESLLQASKYEPRLFDHKTTLFEASKSRQPDCVILDMVVSGPAELQLLEEVKSAFNEAAIIILSPVEDTSRAVAAIKAGASDYIIKPYIDRVLIEAIDSAITQA